MERRWLAGCRGRRCSFCVRSPTAQAESLTEELWRRGRGPPPGWRAPHLGLLPPLPAGNTTEKTGPLCQVPVCLPAGQRPGEERSRGWSPLQVLYQLWTVFLSVDISEGNIQQEAQRLPKDWPATAVAGSAFRMCLCLGEIRPQSSRQS